MLYIAFYNIMYYVIYYYTQYKLFNSINFFSE